MLNYTDKADPTADATLTITKPALNKVQLGEATLAAEVAAGEAKVDGRKEAIDEFLGMLDTFQFWFNIVTP